MPLTKSQINKLGDELRHLDPLDSIPEPALVRLQEFRSLYDAPLVEAQTLIKDRLGLDATSRLKTVNTIVEKLRREKTRLAEMKDVAGLRIVTDGGLMEQEALVEALNDAFPGGKVVDRRSKPSYGYRAVHLVPLVLGLPVEVQVRTRLQDLWAAFERVADRAGRGIRYGIVPPEWADQIASLESASDLVASEDLDREIDERDLAPSEQQIEALRRIREQIRARLTGFIEGTEDLP